MHHHLPEPEEPCRLAAFGFLRIAFLCVTSLSGATLEGDSGLGERVNLALFRSSGGGREGVTGSMISRSTVGTWSGRVKVCSQRLRLNSGKFECNLIGI